MKREARLLKALLGRFTKDSDIVDGFSVTAIGRQWSVGHARIFSCWISGTEKGKVDTEGESTVLVREDSTERFIGLNLLLSRVIDVWAAPEHIKHSLSSEHQCGLS